MPDTPKPHQDLIHKVAGMPPCPGGIAKNYTQKELAALHAFKHEFVAAGFRLYQEVPPEKAHAALAEYFKKVAADL
jgi:hypothetical protein